MLHLRGGKVEPSNNSDHAEHENQYFAALRHSGDLTSVSYSASRQPELVIM